VATERSYETEEKRKEGMSCMIPCTYTEKDPREFMYVKGECYINGSEVILSDEYIKTHTFNGLPLWKYAKFTRRTFYNNQTAFFFSISKYDWTDFVVMGLDPRTRFNYAPYFVVVISELDGAIKEFTNPIKLSKEETEARRKAVEDMISHPKSDFDYPELIAAWLVYIGVLLATLMFRDFYLLWAIETVIFCKYRNGVIDNDN
jgi:hypothetical protein